MSSANASRLRVLEEKEVGLESPPLLDVPQTLSPSEDSMEVLKLRSLLKQREEEGEALKKVLEMVKRALEKERKEQSLVLNFALKLAQVAAQNLTAVALQLLALLGAFGLWIRIIEKPDLLQLGALGLYGVLVIFPTFLWRKSS